MMDKRDGLASNTAIDTFALRQSSTQAFMHCSSECDPRVGISSTSTRCYIITQSFEDKMVDVEEHSGEHGLLA